MEKDAFEATRVNFSNGYSFEVLDIRIRKGRLELLSRWVETDSNGTTIYSFSNRWRKVCGKGVYVPELGREAIDFHSLSINALEPNTGKKVRIYLSKLKW